jgi:P27 family predicted phage terminase small subunit
MKIAPVLIRMGILSELDADGLARYLIAESNYLRVTNRLTAALNSGNLADADKLSSMQDRFFRQCRSAGSDLGLTVSSRCSLVLPGGYQPDEPIEDGDLFGD